MLGLAACGGAAAYVLDEESAAVLDATPTSLAHRVRWRLVLVAMPAAVALTGLLLLDRLDPSTHWLRLVRSPRAAWRSASSSPPRCAAAATGHRATWRA